MIQYPRKIKNFNAFIDGQSYAGRVTEGTLPELKLQLANHRGAGMDGTMAIDMGTEAMKAELILADWPPELIKMFGTRQRFVMRPAAQGETDFTATAFVATIGGRFTVANFGNLKPGDDVPMKLSVEVDYYRMMADGDTLFEIDIASAKRIIGGVDQIASIREAMGL